MCGKGTKQNKKKEKKKKPTSDFCLCADLYSMSVPLFEASEAVPPWSQSPACNPVSDHLYLP